MQHRTHRFNQWTSELQIWEGWSEAGRWGFDFIRRYNIVWCYSTYNFYLMVTGKIYLAISCVHQNMYLVKKFFCRIQLSRHFLIASHVCLSLDKNTQPLTLCRLKRVWRGVGFNPNVHCGGITQAAVVLTGKCDDVVADLREFQGALTRQVSQTVPVTYSGDETGEIIHRTRQ